MRTAKRILAGLLVTSMLVQSGCGTLLYPERRGQLSGQIDPAVAVLNGIGCLFYVIPGLIAFAIDFATGAIYLKGSQYSVAPERLEEAVGENGRIDHQRLRQIIQQDTGLELPLDHPQLIQHTATAEQLATLPLIPAA